MANKLRNSLPTISTFLLLLLLPSLLAFAQDIPPTTSVPRNAICRLTRDPSFCNSVLPPQNGNVYFFGHASFIRSLSQAVISLNLVNTYLRRRPFLPDYTIHALEDCRTLSELNLDLLSSSFKTVNRTDTFLPDLQADDIQTFLSAILTNQQTCLEGLQSSESASSVGNELTDPLINDTRLYSVSLALFTQGWVPRNRRPQSVYQTVVSRRKLLQATLPDGVKVSARVRVSKDGSGNFITINAAIAAAPTGASSTAGYFLIHVTEGVYEEYVSISKTKTYLMIVGDGINKTVITGSRSVVDGWTTFQSATFAVVGAGFVGMNMTIRNTAGAAKHQAVALRNGADLSTFYGCSFEGYQDTLYTHSLRQFYRECNIYGTVDFIFGNAAVVFQKCNIYPRLPLSGQFNAITAQGRIDPNQNTGTSIQQCSIQPAADLAANTNAANTYLGRPWKEFSRTVFMQSFIDSVVDPAGWQEWNGNFALSTLYYAEFDNTGPGSSTATRVTWPGYHVIDANDAANFTVDRFLLGNDWLLQTGVAYDSNLI